MVKMHLFSNTSCVIPNTFKHTLVARKIRCNKQFPSHNLVCIGKKDFKLTAEVLKEVIQHDQDLSRVFGLESLDVEAVVQEEVEVHL